MKNPNDSYWTSGSDVRIPEYEPGFAKVESASVGVATNGQVAVTPAERKVILDRRFADSWWRIWWPFERRARQQFVEESDE